MSETASTGAHLTTLEYRLMENGFTQLVIASWSNAVMKAAKEMADFRPDVLAALRAANSQVRSAAVAALNEANDVLAHDEVAALLDDPSEDVRAEALEYLQEFAQPKDAQSLCERIGRAGYDPFLLTWALSRILEVPDGLLDDDDSVVKLGEVRAKWERALADAGLS